MNNATKREAAIKKRGVPIALALIAVGVVVFLAALYLGARGGRVYINGSGLHAVQNDEGVLTNEYASDAFSGVSVEASSADVMFIPSDHFGVEVYLPDNDEEPTVRVGGDGTLTVVVKPAAVSVNVLDLNVSRRYVKVYYPKETSLDAIRAQTSSGSVSLEETSVGRLSVKTSSGDIRTTATGYAELSLESNSGSIRHGGVGVEASASFKTSSGGVKASLSGCTSASVVSSSGRVEITDGEGTALTAEASSGDVSINGGSWRDLRVTTSSGYVRFDGALSGGADVKSSSGGVTLSVSGAAERGYALSSSSGSISVNGQKYEKRADAQPLSAADGTITVKTSSGSIKLVFSR